MAFSGDGGESWLVVSATPDLREQIIANPALHPRAPRHSPIAAVAIVSADVDGISGLIVLREKQPFRLLAAGPMLDIIESNSVFGVLDPALVKRERVVVNEPVTIGSELRLTLLTMPGKVPLYLETQGAQVAEEGPTYAALVEAHGRKAIFAPACSRIDHGVKEKLSAADAVFFDGTVYHDDELIAAGVGTKTGQRMGHVCMSGPQGSVSRLSDLPGRRIYVHINNTNPVLLDGSPERQAVEAAGWTVAHDGLEVNV